MSTPILTHYGKVQIPSIKTGEPDSGGISHFQINTRYINNTQKVIRAKLRSNMELTFPAVPHRTPHSRDHQFLVRHELVVSAACTEQMKNYFSTLSEDVTGALELFRNVYLKVYEDVYKPFQRNDLRCVIEYVFTERDLMETNGVFYHDELDTLFKFGDEPFEVPHPHSFAGRKLAGEHNANELREKHGFIFWVEIIDNLGKYGDRYLSICNQVYKIVAREDKNRPDGLYIVSSKPTNGKINPNEVSTKYYRFEDVEKELGIYPTYEQALSYGDVALTRKRELAELEHAIALERQEFQREKSHHEREKLHYEAELEDKNRRLKDMEYERSLHARSMEDLRGQQNTLLEMERLRLKEMYERRSSERKDASEFIKFLPSILAAVGTLLMAYKAFRTTSS